MLVVVVNSGGIVGFFTDLMLARDGGEDGLKSGPSIVGGLVIDHLRYCIFRQRGIEDA